MVGATADLDKSPRRVPGVRWPLPIGGVLSTRGNVRRALFRAFGKRKPFVFTHAFLVHGRRHASTLVLCGRIKRMRCCFFVCLSSVCLLWVFVCVSCCSAVFYFGKPCRRACVLRCHHLLSEATLVSLICGFFFPFFLFFFLPSLSADQFEALFLRARGRNDPRLYIFLHNSAWAGD